MTEVIAAPVLHLPLVPLVTAQAVLDDAVAAVRRAQEAEWVSTAATAYRAELLGTLRDLHALAAAVDDARDQWMRARHVAWSHGQL